MPTNRQGFCRFVHSNGLSLVLCVLFVASLIGQGIAGWLEENQYRLQHSLVPIQLADYLLSGSFLELTMENWESEFLQMFVYVVFTIFLYQRGSSESKDPDAPAEPEPQPTVQSPAWARAAGWRRIWYANSMSLFFLAAFLLTFFLHAVGGAAQYDDEQRAHGQQAISVLTYLASSRFWLESLQNWQSEFLSLFAMVIISIYLRQKGSPESKGVNSPHNHTGR